jgi:hypothetical protein
VRRLLPTLFHSATLELDDVAFTIKAMHIGVGDSVAHAPAEFERGIDPGLKDSVGDDPTLDLATLLTSW